MHNDRLTLLRDLLHGPPSLEAWAAICELLDAWEHGGGLDVAIDYIEAHQQPWPDAYRFAPAAWVDRFLTPTPDPRRRLVRTLIIEHRRLTPAHVDALADALAESAILHLDLVHCHLDDDGARRLFKSPGLASLRSLRLRDNLLLGDLTDALGACPHLGHLARLEITGSDRLGSRVATAVADAAHLRALRRLTLSHDALEDQGAIALLDSPLLADLTHLSLAGNLLTDVTAEAVADCAETWNLDELDLSGNNLSSVGYGLLASSPFLSDRARGRYLMRR